MYVADILSREYLNTVRHETSEMEEDVKATIHTLIKNLPFNEEKIHNLKESTNDDRELTDLKKTVENGWPHHKSNVPDSVKQFWNYQDEIHVEEDLVFVGDRIIIPAEQQEYVLSVLHKSHLEMEKCKDRAKKSVFWVNMNHDIERKCSQCGTCELLCTSKDYLEKQRFVFIYNFFEFLSFRIFEVFQLRIQVTKNVRILKTRKTKNFIFQVL